jgi:hypothetical protein
LATNQGVVGSIPASRTKWNKDLASKGAKSFLLCGIRGRIVSGKLDKHWDLSNFDRLAMPVNQSRVHQDFMVARQLISNRIKYRSSHKLFLQMASRVVSYTETRHRTQP